MIEVDIDRLVFVIFFFGSPLIFLLPVKLYDLWEKHIEQG